MSEKQNNLSNLEAMRHSAEHVLTMAMVKIYPGLKPAMGPAIEEGFYFDFDFDDKIQEKDFPQIEQAMQEIVSGDYPITRQEIEVKQARGLFSGNPYKLEWVDEIEKRGEKASVYWIGDPKASDSFVDLCSGPHVSSTSKIGPFKLLSIAGAYWHGDEKNKMLTRIYGTAFNNQKDLDHYLWQQEEAEKRNHRRLGAELELFAIFPEIGQGLPIWLPNGFIIRRELENYMLQAERKLDYQHIITPVISKEDLFKTSGHLGFYDNSMYPPIEVDNEKLYLKPMSCPGAIITFKSKPRSYRDLPIKLGEFGLVYRYEKSGELHGLQRVRGFTQNDAHIFCREDQFNNQLTEVINLFKTFYQDLGFTNYWFRLSLSDPKDKKYDIAPRSEWLKAENALREVLDKNSIDYKEAPGEAVFYGPKLDVQAVNVFGKEDTISTIQIDFNLPKRFKLEYTDAHNQPQQPYLIHRALIGSFERFFAFLIEYYAGAFPVWLSPVQVAVLPIAQRHASYASSIKVLLQNEGIRTELDERPETLEAKIRDSQLKKVPYMLVVGDKEQESETVSLRLRTGENVGQITLKDFIVRLKRTVLEKETQLW